MLQIAEPVGHDVDPGGEQASGNTGRYEHHPNLAAVQQLGDLAHEPCPPRQGPNAQSLLGVLEDPVDGGQIVVDTATRALVGPGVGVVEGGLGGVLVEGGIGVEGLGVEGDSRVVGRVGWIGRENERGGRGNGREEGVAGRGLLTTLEGDSARTGVKTSWGEKERLKREEIPVSSVVSVPEM